MKFHRPGIHTGVFPDVLKEARIIPIHKGGPSEDPSNYTPISILPRVCRQTDGCLAFSCCRILRRAR